MKKPVRVLALHRETIRVIKALEVCVLIHVTGGSAANSPALRIESGNINCPAHAAPP